MTRRKNNKRALTLSLLSLLLCMAMLVGSTFAWFTDNATTKVNTIQAGTLDIQLLDAESATANSLEGKTLTFAKAADAPEGEAVLFEPGAKYSLQQVWLYNAGNLHAKYKVVISGIDGNSELAKVLDVIVDGQNCGTLASLAAQSGVVKENTIAPKAFDTFGTIELMMQTTAGNEYMGLTMEGIAITVMATQAPVEYDSHNNTYDENAQYGGLENIKAQGFTNVVEVTPETCKGENGLMNDGNLKSNTVYVLKAGTYSNGLLINATWNAGTDAKIAIYAEDGAKFPNGNVQVLGSGSEIWVENIQHEGTLIVNGGYKNINVRNNTVKTIIVTAGSTERNIVVEGNKVDGSGEDRHNGNDKYGCYIVGGNQKENVTITNNIFRNSYSHCVHLQQGNWDKINIKGNTFDAWGTNGEADRGALKMWGDSVYAPNNTEATDAMKALATEFINNNTFMNQVEGNSCYVNAYDIVINE